MSLFNNQLDITSNQYCRDIDNEVLIEEVKDRPALYNRNVKEYNDQHYKRSMWEEISAKIYHNTWDEMNEAQKEAKGAEVLKRWNNLRSCFSRELRLMRDPLQNKRKKYIYFDKLLFLLEEVRPDLTIKEPTFDFTTNSLDHEEDHEQNSIFENTQEKKVSKKTNLKRDMEKYVQRSIMKLREELAFKERREDSEESKSKTVDTDADTNFSLSLVPMLNMIPIDQKIDAQIEILNILKKYTKAATCDYRIAKFEREEQSEADDNSEVLCYYGEEK